MSDSRYIIVFSLFILSGFVKSTENGKAAPDKKIRPVFKKIRRQQLAVKNGINDSQATFLDKFMIMAQAVTMMTYLNKSSINGNDIASCNQLCINT